MTFEEELFLYIINTYGMIRIDATKYPQVAAILNSNTFDKLVLLGHRRSARVEL